jgi:hypothetical protein
MKLNDFTKYKTLRSNRQPQVEERSDEIPGIGMRRREATDDRRLRNEVTDRRRLRNEVTKSRESGRDIMRCQTTAGSKTINQHTAIPYIPVPFCLILILIEFGIVFSLIRMRYPPPPAPESLHASALSLY